MTTIKVINDTDVGTTLDISTGKLEAASTMATDAEVAAAIADQDATENAEESIAKLRTDYLRRAQYHLTTAAMIEIVGASIKFHPDGVYNLSRVLLIGSGEGAHSGADGYFNINPPPAGTLVKGLGIPDVAVDADGFIPVTQYGTLYYKLPPAGASSGTQGEWYIAQYGQGDYIVPDDFLFICRQTQDVIGEMFQMFDGRQLFQGKNYTDTGWVDMAPYFTAGVSAYANGYQIPRFRRLNNRVYLEGVLNHGSAGYVGGLANLPDGFRPSKQHVFTAQTHLGTARVDISPDGYVQIVTNTGSQNWVSLDEINFGL